jgi:hypothetical protein
MLVPVLLRSAPIYDALRERAAHAAARINGPTAGDRDPGQPAGRAR